MQTGTLEQYRILDRLLEGCQVISADWRYLYVNDAVVRHGRRTKEELVGRTMMEAYPGIEKTDMFAALKRCMEERQSCNLENEFTYPIGGTGWFELRIEPVPEGLFVLSVDITARKRAEQAIGQQLRRLRALRAIDLSILGSTDFRLALKTVLEETIRNLAVDVAAVFLLNPGAATLDVVEAIGLRTAGNARVRVGEGAIGQAALMRRAVVVADLAQGTAHVPPAWLHDGIRALSAVPLVAKGQIIGALAAAHRAPLRVDDDWLGFLEALAGQAAMAIDAGRSFEELQRSNLELSVAYETTIEGWSNALDLRDQDTSYHTLRVADTTVELARLAGMSSAELLQVRRGALLHDIGKIAIPDSILRKPGRLSDEEWAIMRRHPTHAYELLWPIPYLRPALDIPYCHHEKWDGSGYPRGLKGEAIPLAARLFAVVDVWDALRSDRPYRESWPEATVLEHLRTMSGSHLDPNTVDLFVTMRGGAHRRG